MSRLDGRLKRLEAAMVPPQQSIDEVYWDLVYCRRTWDSLTPEQQAGCRDKTEEANERWRQAQLASPAMQVVDRECRRLGLEDLDLAIIRECIRLDVRPDLIQLAVYYSGIPTPGPGAAAPQTTLLADLDCELENISDEGILDFIAQWSKSPRRPEHA